MSEKSGNVDALVAKMFEKMQQNLRFVFFLFALCMIYIWNNHMAQKLVTDINKKAKELKEMRWDYLTKKSDLMYKSKLTEVLPKANELGLSELQSPPYRINIKNKQYKRQD